MTTLGRNTEAVASAASTHDIIRNAREAGIDQFDPFWPFVKTLCRTTAEMAGTTADIRRAGIEVVQEIRRAHGRLDAQERNIYCALVERAARRTAVRWTATVVGMIVAAQVGFYSGQARKTSDEHSSPIKQNTDFPTPVNVEWQKIRAWNDLGSAFITCQPEIDHREAAKGRRFCEIPLYIEAPK